MSTDGIYRNANLSGEYVKARHHVRDAVCRFRENFSEITSPLSESASKMMEGWIEDAIDCFNEDFQGRLPTDQLVQIRQLLHHKLSCRMLTISKPSPTARNQHHRAEQHQGFGLTYISLKNLFPDMECKNNGKVRIHLICRFRPTSQTGS